jgi:hypothetical protein
VLDEANQPLPGFCGDEAVSAMKVDELRWHF